MMFASQSNASKEGVIPEAKSDEGAAIPLAQMRKPEGGARDDWLSCEVDVERGHFPDMRLVGKPDIEGGPDHPHIWKV